MLGAFDTRIKPCNGNPSTHHCYNCSLFGVCNARGKSIPDGQGNAWTCFAFTTYVVNQVFKIKNSQLKLIVDKKPSNVADTFKSARPGDIIYFYRTVNESAGHYAVCMGTTDTTITLYECNSTTNYSQVAVMAYRTFKYSDMAIYHPSYRYCSVYSAINYDQVNGTIANGTYTLAPACAPSMRLDVAGGSTGNGANVQIYTNNGSDAQKWEVTSLGNGYYSLIAKCSGKALDSLDFSDTNRRNVIQDSPDGGTYQQWKLKDAGNGYYYLIPRYSEGCCLDVSGGGITNGTNVQIYAANQSTAQKWKLTRVDQPTKPTNLTLSTDKSSYTLGETATITPAATNATHFAMSIWLGAFSTGTRVYAQNTIYGAVTFKPTQAGNYTIRVDAKNNAGYISTEKTFTVTSSSNGNGGWGPWSDWSTTPVTATSTRQVETRQTKVSDAYTEYRYGGYYCYDSRGKIHDCWCATYLKKLYGGATLRYSDWSKTRYTAKPGSKAIWTCGACNGTHIGVSFYSGGRPWWHEYGLPGGNNYYWEESRTVDAKYVTEYRYRDRIGG